jgi:hypothetical protein
MEETDKPDAGEKIHEFKESDRAFIAVSEEEQDTGSIVLGVSGFGLTLVYSEEYLTSVERIEEAAQSLAANLVQLLLDGKLGA